MLGEFVECSTTNIAGTAGNGAVTLSRYNGMPIPSDIWGANTIDVDYTMSDLSTSPTVPKLEKGLGTITGGILTRERPRITWNGTTFDEHLPAALQFGATPPLGNVRVRIAPNADIFVQAPPAFALAASSGGGYLGDWLPTSNLIGPPGVNAEMPIYPGYEYYIPYLCAIRGNIIGMGAVITTAGAATNFRMGIYGVGADGLPGPCISLTRAIAVNVTGLRIDSSPALWTVRPGPLMLRAGWFYIGLLAVGTASYVGLGATTRASLCGPTPLGMYDAYGWGSICFRLGSGASVVLPTGVPLGPYDDAPIPIPNLNVPSVLLAFSN